MEQRLNATDSRIVFGGNESSIQPTDVIIDRNDGSLIMADEGNRQVIRCCQQPGSDGEILISDIDHC